MIPRTRVWLALAIAAACAGAPPGEPGADDLARGRSLLEKGDATAALAVLEGVVATRPEAANDLARAAKAAGREAEGLAAIEACLAGHPDDARALFAAASLRMDLERLGEAEHDLRRALDSHPADPPSLLLLSRLLTQENRAREAVALLEEAEETVAGPGSRPGAGPSDRRWAALFLKHLGFALLVDGDAAGAETRFAAATGLDAGYAEAHYGLGLARLSLGELPAALEALERAGELDPRHLEAAYQTMNVAERLGRAETAREARFRFASLYRARLDAAGALGP